MLFPYRSSFPGVVCRLPRCGIRGGDTFDFRHQKRGWGSQAFSDGAFQGPGVTHTSRATDHSVRHRCSHRAPPRLKTTYKTNESTKMWTKSRISQRENLCVSCLSAPLGKVRGSWQHTVGFADILASLCIVLRSYFFHFFSCRLCNTTSLHSLSQEMTIGCRIPYKLIGSDSLKE